MGVFTLDGSPRLVSAKASLIPTLMARRVKVFEFANFSGRCSTGRATQGYYLF